MLLDWESAAILTEVNDKFLLKMLCLKFYCYSSGLEAYFTLSFLSF